MTTHPLPPTISCSRHFFSSLQTRENSKIVSSFFSIASCRHEKNFEIFFLLAKEEEILLLIKFSFLAFCCVARMAHSSHSSRLGWRLQLCWLTQNSQKGGFLPLSCARDVCSVLVLHLERRDSRNKFNEVLSWAQSGLEGKSQQARRGRRRKTFPPEHIPMRESYFKEHFWITNTLWN